MKLLQPHFPQPEFLHPQVLTVQKKWIQPWFLLTMSVVVQLMVCFRGHYMWWVEYIQKCRSSLNNDLFILPPFKHCNEELSFSITACNTIKSWNFSLTISRTFQAFKTGISTPLLPVPPPSSLPFCLWLLSSFKHIMYGFDIILVCRKFQYLMIFKGISWGYLFLFFIIKIYHMKRLLLPSWFRLMVISFLVEIKISWEFNVTLVYPCSIHFHIKPLK